MAVRWYVAASTGGLGLALIEGPGWGGVGGWTKSRPWQLLHGSSAQSTYSSSLSQTAITTVFMVARSCGHVGLGGTNSGQSISITSNEWGGEGLEDSSGGRRGIFWKVGDSDGRWLAMARVGWVMVGAASAYWRVGSGARGRAAGSGMASWRTCPRSSSSSILLCCGTKGKTRIIENHVPRL